jgi:hypothetical protein
MEPCTSLGMGARTSAKRLKFRSYKLLRLASLIANGSNSSVKGS